MLLSIAYVVTISFVIRCKITSAEVGELNAVQSVGWRNSVIYKECNYTPKCADSVLHIAGSTHGFMLKCHTFTLVHA